MTVVKHSIFWKDLEKEFEGLSTDKKHQISVQREAIPIIFIPGIMGSRLQCTKSKWYDGLPKTRWDPSLSWMFLYYFGVGGATRKRMLIGTRFDSGYLEPIHDSGKSNGFEGIMKDYCGFLDDLNNTHDWGAIGKIFVLPVYAFGYNWTGTVEDAGNKLQAKIKQIIDEAKGITGICEKVIVITHSMGGLVARWASEHGPAPARDDILGIIHGVQPATGSPAGYWRMKAGFEGDTGPALALGYNGREVTPILGNAPGGLSLLPNKLYRIDAKGNDAQWLTLADGTKLPASRYAPNPYNDIYRIPAVVSPKNSSSPSLNTYWGLVDPDLLDPENTMSSGNSSGSNSIDDVDARTGIAAWDQFIDMLDLAEKLHYELKDDHHAITFCSQGEHLANGRPRTADSISYRAESRSWNTFRNYPGQGFRGFYRDGAGNRMQAVLQEPSGKGDGTVPLSSSGILNKYTTLTPKHTVEAVEHQHAYQQDSIQNFTRAAISALCHKRYKDIRGCSH